MTEWYDIPSDEMTLGEARAAVKELRDTIVYKEKEINHLKSEIHELRARCYPGAEKWFDKSMYGVLTIIESTQLDKIKTTRKAPPQKIDAIKNNNNAEIRKALIDKGIRYYEAATACGVSLYTFSHWLQTEMNPEKKQKVLKAIESIE